MAISVDKDKCTLCGVCAASCPPGAISVGDEVEIDQVLCLECGLCINECPVGALSFDSAAKEEPQKETPARERSEPVPGNPAGSTLAAGSGTGRGGRRGGRGRGRGMGPGDVCLCMNCNRTFPHQRGMPCAEMRCPECGTPLVRGDG